VAGISGRYCLARGKKWVHSLRLFKSTFRFRDSEPRKEAREWSARMMHDGRRDVFQLGTSHHDNAAAKAVEIFRYLKANGWQAVLTKYKPESTAKLPKSEIETVGDFLQELGGKADIKPKTLEGYAIAFRSIVASISGIAGGGPEGEASQPARNGGKRFTRSSCRRSLLHELPNGRKASWPDILLILFRNEKREFRSTPCFEGQSLSMLR
jgi:hypothetical protein